VGILWPGMLGLLALGVAFLTLSVLRFRTHLEWARGVEVSGTIRLGYPRLGWRHILPLVTGGTMRSVEFILLASTSLFVIVDPVAAVPAFLAMTPNDTAQRRRRTAALACWIMTAVLVTFALAGSWIFRLLGITLPAFQLAASLVLLLIALDMLRAQRSRVRETPEETDAGLAKDEIAIAPLAIPMLAGPGAISTVILLHYEARTWIEQILLCICIGGVAAVTYLILRFAAHGGRWLSPIATRIATRIMGLLLAAVAFQFMANAVKALKLLGP